MTVPATRIRRLGSHPIRPAGQHVVVYMTATRRITHNYALQRGVELAIEHSVPLVILEALRCGYQYASDRIHAFVLQGMAEHAAALAPLPVLYHPWVEPQPGAGKGLLAAWADHAVAVVADDHPGFFYPRMLRAAARQVSCAFEAVDSVGLMPLSVSPKPYARAHDFRRFFQKTAVPHLEQPPQAAPLDQLPTDHPTLPAIPSHIAERWPAASAALLSADPAALKALPIDHTVAPVPLVGGTQAARSRWQQFFEQELPRYTAGRRVMQADRSSGLSPWLHFGHISPHELFDDIVSRYGAVPADDVRPAGKRHGWWGLPEDVEAFLDELVTWREVGHHFLHHVPNAHEYDTLPAWARKTLEEHADDPRPQIVSVEDLAAGRSPDPLWNAAQLQLVRDGRMHNYLRMLWGKRILEWTAHPRDALAVMLELNDRFALDGRDPNSISGITWVLGRFDRAWGPERPIYGKIRYMSSLNTAKKLKVTPEKILGWTAAERQSSLGF
ncbi:MAG: deoxyribodipyrimidine photolyase [Deltaproteobacteria bacterium]|nr:deoxyribodipyrimidine photolyase [Deltaproteobacteria bacterium]HCH66852.1 deoxyribodipyrimidine photolyase [Deltaproteobacteria bacterium]